MSRIATSILLIAASVLCSCGEDESGLQCKSGEFYLDGEEFEDCGQCSSSDDCGFEAKVTQICTYPNGVQRCTVSSGTVVARCAGQTAKVVITNGEHSCAK